MSVPTRLSRLTFAFLLASPVAAFAAPSDYIKTIVDTTNAIGTGASVNLQSFAYDPSLNRVFTFGGGQSNENAHIRQVTGIDTATLSSSMYVSKGAWTNFAQYQAANSGTTSAIGGLPMSLGTLFNPKPIGAIPAFGQIWMADAVQVSAGGVDQKQYSPRFYRYDTLQNGRVGDAEPLSAVNEMNVVATWQDLVNAGLATTPSGSTNVNRRFTWSGDGQFIYYVDSNSGIGKVNPLGGSVTRILPEVDDLNTEPAVRSAGTVDTIFFRGGGTTGNVGGIDFFTHDLSTGTSSTRQIYKTAAEMTDFLEYGTFTIGNNVTMAADADGNLYFNELSSGSTRPNRRGFYRIDKFGRMSKVIGYDERNAGLGAAGTTTFNTFRLQPRTVQYTNGTLNFDVTQILWAELTPLNRVAGAYVFKPGDFDRDNQVTQTDVAALKSKLTPKATAAALNDLIYDMNNSGSVSWKDVKVFQQFYAFNNGDANIDQVVDSTDFTALVAAFGKSAGALWTEGDFTGDEKVSTLDFNVLAANFGAAPPVLPDAAAMLGTVVPEPASIGAAIVVASMATLRRRRTH